MKKDIFSSEIRLLKKVHLVLNFKFTRVNNRNFKKISFVFGYTRLYLENSIFQRLTAIWVFVFNLRLSSEFCDIKMSKKANPDLRKETLFKKIIVIDREGQLR